MSILKLSGNIRRSLPTVEAADVLVVESPVYRASTRALKHLFDPVDDRALPTSIDATKSVVDAYAIASLAVQERIVRAVSELRQILLSATLTNAASGTSAVRRIVSASRA